MITIKDKFSIEIEELRQHLNYVKNISSDIKTDSLLISYLNSITKKKFNYKSLIISLYGIVENYAEKFIIKYLENLKLFILEYKNLNIKIKENNLYNSANLTLKVIGQKHVKYNHLKENELISNLHSCLSNADDYFLNFESFTILSGNLKHSKMCDLFKQVNVDLNAGFIKFTDFNLSKSENQFKKLDDLVEMRNEIAHGNISILLDPSQIEEYVDFIEKYFNNLYKLLVYTLEQEKLSYWVQFHAIQIENITVFDGNIIGFTNDKNILYTRESTIIIRKIDGTYLEASIENIKTKGNKVVTIKLKSSTSIKKNQNFFLKSNNSTVANIQSATRNSLKQNPLQ